MAQLRDRNAHWGVICDTVNTTNPVFSATLHDYADKIWEHHPQVLVRRLEDQQLVPTVARTQLEYSNEWGLGNKVFDSNAHIGGGHAENDNMEGLERAQVAKREEQAKQKQIPPFVQKLNSLLDDAKNDELIRWSEQGDSFVVLDEYEFAKNLIPKLFKHNKYASFVRQLYMYGFKKRVGLFNNSMNVSEYYNQYFKRGHPNLLWLIKKSYHCHYADTLDCERTFTSSSHASRHSKIHLSEKDIQCAFEGCPMRFTRTDNMKEHLETHFKEPITRRIQRARVARAARAPRSRAWALDPAARCAPNQNRC